MTRIRARLIALLAAASVVSMPLLAEKRSAISHPRTPFRLAFYKRHEPTYQVAGALHFAHGKLHDVLLLHPFAAHAEADAEFYGEIMAMMARPPRVEPTQEYYASYMARVAWRLFRTIDWTHALHEMTYDAIADPSIAWPDKSAALDRAWEIYARQRDQGIVMSPAPLDLTMRRAAVMMKPYFSLTRNYYPQSNNFFYAAHWWHPATYEAMMTGGNGAGQDRNLARIDEVLREQVIPNPPLRMILSREGMPRYSRLSPRTANAFDNLHMLHGIAYDIAAYDAWTPAEKRAELYRVIDAMSYHPGDEALARRFSVPRPDLDPLDYDGWLASGEGSMNSIMGEMLTEMMAEHGGEHGDQGSLHAEHAEHAGGGESEDPMAALRAQLLLKLTPDLQPWEIEGSFLDAMRQLMPAMAVAPETEAAGQVAPGMVAAMLRGWEEKVTHVEELAPWPMESDPGLPTE
ncbi:MAG: hypothetical protein VYE73_06450 [Acidobacteriota bacterium]|nr:hypothetical protein [Acidobacteriota bacterium]